MVATLTPRSASRTPAVAPPARAPGTIWELGAGAVAGVIAVIHDGKIEWARGFGVTRVGGPPVTEDTLFQAASISKPVTAMAAMRFW